MNEPDNDFEFDFFDEPSTRETAVAARPGRRGGRPPVRPPSGLTPLLRLVGLIAFAILAVVVLVFVIQGCREENQEGEYRTYMENVSQLASESEAIGRELNNVLTTPGIRQRQLERNLNGLSQRQQQLVASSQGLDPPGRLVDEQQAVVEAFQLRVRGVRGLEDTFRRTADSQDADAAGRSLAAQAERLVASDVIWTDLFREPARQELSREGVIGVPVPASDFLVNPDLATSATMRPIWQRIHGARTGGAPAGLHGNGIVSTTVLPGEEELSQDTETTVEATVDLAFEVTVENSGEFQEAQVEVSLTIPRPSGRPISQRQMIDLISPGEQKAVRFSDLGQPPFGSPTSVKVAVKPVPGEENTANNTAEYPVIFSFE
ncbi:MAG: hypothetical protein M3322_07470 [Actinomycetota bacterium]|nr:hypothetical protein [Actinomycetota bacterium]